MHLVDSMRRAAPACRPTQASYSLAAHRKATSLNLALRVVLRPSGGARFLRKTTAGQTRERRPAPATACSPLLS